MPCLNEPGTRRVGIIRGCLSLIGLLCVLAVGGCVLGVSSCAYVANPKVFSETVDEEPGKVTRMLEDYLQSATFESDASHQVAGRPAKVAVQDFTDGSIHLTLDAPDRRLVEVVARVTPADAGRSRVEVVSDATALAAVGRTRAA